MNFEAMLKEFTKAVEAGDGTALAALFTEDGVYDDTFYGEARGRDAIRHMLEEEFHGHARDFLWEMHSPVCDGNTGYACWNFSYTSNLPESAGRRVVARGMSCFRLHEGKITEYREKFDSGMALAQLDFDPARLMKLFGRWNGAVREQPDLARHVAGPGAQE